MLFPCWLYESCLLVQSLDATHDMNFQEDTHDTKRQCYCPAKDRKLPLGFTRYNKNNTIQHSIDPFWIKE